LTKNHVISAESNLALEKSESGYILDAFYKYIAAYFDGRPLPLELPKGSFKLEGDYYVLKDTFSSFCKNGDIEGDMRRRVKAALFPEEGKLGLLESIIFLYGKKNYLEKRFISFRTMLGVETGRANPLTNESEYEIVHFTLEIRADVLSFLEQRNAIKASHR
jgi:hypothetical protein